MIIENDGFIYFVKRNDGEIIDYFFERANFIAKLKPKTIEEYNKYELYSRIQINVKYNKCTYNNDVMNELHSLIVKM